MVTPLFILFFLLLILVPIIGVEVKMKRETTYWGQPDEGRKLKPTPKLLENVRKLYREEIEKFYPDI